VVSRESLPSPLVPRQPKTALGWTMQKFRQLNVVGVRQLAQEFGCSASHISRVERGDTKPSRALVDFYEDRFQAEGLLRSLLEVVEHAREQKRQRESKARRRQPRARPGDATAFVCETVPQGTQLQPGEVFTKSWTIRNVGAVAWEGRQLERQGPLTGPGLITSARHYPIANTAAGDAVTISSILKAPTHDATSIAYFKMVDADGLLCFPDEHQLGLDVLVRVIRNVAGVQ
jgi:transcriptional regulator with XRE-family HTH domain